MMTVDRREVVVGRPADRQEEVRPVTPPARRLPGVLAVLLVAGCSSPEATVVLTAPHETSATRTSATPTSPPVTATLSPTQQLAAELRTVGARTPDTGYAGVLPRADGSLDLWWHGAVPADVASLEQAYASVTVRHHPARWSAARLAQAAAAVRGGDPRLRALGVRIEDVATARDGSGLRLTWLPASSSGRVPTEEQVRAAAARVAGVAVLSARSALSGGLGAG